MRFSRESADGQAHRRMDTQTGLDPTQCKSTEIESSTVAVRVKDYRKQTIPLDNFGTVVAVGENPDCLLLSGTVVGENPDHVCWDGSH